MWQKRRFGRHAHVAGTPMWHGFGPRADGSPSVGAGAKSAIETNLQLGQICVWQASSGGGHSEDSSFEAMQQGLRLFGLFNMMVSACDAVSGPWVRMVLLALGAPAVAYHPRTRRGDCSGKT